MAEIVWSESALQDIEQIGNYIALDSVRYSEITVNRLFVKTQILEVFPNMGRIVPEYQLEWLREIIEGSYRIVYKIDQKSDRIEIVTVHHSKQQLKNWPPV